MFSPDSLMCSNVFAGEDRVGFWCFGRAGSLFDATAIPGMMSCVERYSSQTQPVCSFPGATVTRAALKVWERAPVTLQTRALFIFSGGDSIPPPAALRHSPELSGTKHFLFHPLQRHTRGLRVESCSPFRELKKWQVV